MSTNDLVALEESELDVPYSLPSHTKKRTCTRRLVLALFALLLLALIATGVALLLTRADANAVASAGGLVLLRVRGGTVWTGDGDGRVYRAMLINETSGRIVRLLDEEAEQTEQDQQYEERELPGALVLPAFQDSHIHLADGGLDQLHCSLFDAATLDAALAALQACVDALPESARWLQAGGYALPIFTASTGPPSSAMLDRLTGARELAIFVWSADGHACWFNSRFAARANATDSGGSAHEERCGTLAAILPPPSAAQRERAVLLAQRIALAAGVTSLVEANADRATLAAYRALEARGALRMRVALSIGWEALEDGAADVDERARQIAALQRAGDERNASVLVRPTSVKLFLDGVLEAATAHLLRPYAGSNSTGSPRYTQAALNRICAALYRQKLAVHMHAIGDAAVRAGLDAHAFARRTTGLASPGSQLAHLQLVARADVPRFAQLNVSSNWEPFWFENDQYVTELTVPKIGAERSARMYPMREVLAGGAHFVCGSDWTVSSLEPLRAIARAVRRSGKAGEAPLAADQAISVFDAVRCYTRNGAQLLGLASVYGSLGAGRDATFVALDRNIFQVDARSTNAIDDTRVLATYFMGQKVFDINDKMNEQ